MNKVEHLKKGMLEALTKSLGIVSTACETVGISRTTYYKYYNEDTEFKNQADDVSEIAIDCAESKLFELVKAGNITAIIFFLKTKGKKRGYVERQEIEVRDVEQPTIIQIVAYGEDKVEEDKAEVL